MTVRTFCMYIFWRSIQMLVVTAGLTCGVKLGVTV